jgi:ABC-type polysaccharide/polyol phosphate transport system ATPase subunit
LSNRAIHTDLLSKRYQLGTREPYGTLRDALTKLWRVPFGTPEPATDRTIWALKDVSLDIDHGEIIGIVGRNGSGKSTLLKILSRITEPTSGSASVRGRVGSLLEVGTGFHPELTGRENVFVNGAILGMKRKEIASKFDEMIAFADVGRFIDTPVKHYSSGMQMRLAFSVAAHLEPHILLVDEVLAVGDVAFQKKCLGKMDDVSREGRTVLFVSHQMNQLRRLCTRCVWLDADVTNRYEASFMRQVNDPSDAARSPGARFLGWTLGRPGDSNHELDTFGPTTVCFVLRIDRPIANGHHGIALYDANGQVMWGTGTDNLQLAPGTYDIVYDLRSLLLRPGPYRWHVSIFDSGRLIENSDCIPELGVKTVPVGHRNDEYAGFLNLPYSLQIRRQDERQAEADGADVPKRYAAHSL